MTDENPNGITMEIGDDTMLAAIGPWLEPMSAVIADAAGDYSTAFSDLVKDALWAAAVEGMARAAGELSAQFTEALSARVGQECPAFTHFEISGGAVDFIAKRET